MDGVSAQENQPLSTSSPASEGEMGALMRSLDWSKTPLGPVEHWPQSLRTSVSICLSSRHPMLIWWGPELVMIYNDAYRPILGSIKHPAAMGQRGSECWPEIWNIIGPMLEGVMTTGTATWSTNQLLPLERNGYPEECYFTFSYSPIRDETGGVGGVFTAVTETTGQVLGERRLRTLHDLTERTADASTAAETCSIAVEVLAENAADIPFALLYLLENNGKQAHLAGNHGLGANTPVSPLVIDMTVEEQTDAATWPLEQVTFSGQAKLIEQLTERFDPLLVQTAYGTAQSALILPLSHPGQVIPFGLLVAGISPLRALDDDYKNFFELVAGQIGNTIAKARALQEARERAEALAELDRAKTSFFSNVSHEFRTPLTLLLGPVEEALDEENSVSSTETVSPGEVARRRRQRERLEVVRRNSLRLLKLVNTLLDFSRIEAGRMQAVYESTDLGSFTADLASTFRSALEQAQLHFVVDCRPLHEPVYVDRDMWEKIVLNLLSNAFKFTFEGQITVSLREHGSFVELIVSDTGTGIPEAELSHLFERFHRIRGARARTYEGSGIGLALVQELVRLHGGTVQVASAVDQGTTFTVTIPSGTAHLPQERIRSGGPEWTETYSSLGTTPYIEEALRWLPEVPAKPTDALVNPIQRIDQDSAQQSIAAKGKNEPKTKISETAHILLADDNTDMRDYLKRLLSTRYSVDAVTNGAAVLAAAFERTPDLVLSDIMMPELDGFQLLHALRADPRTSTVPVILLSARAGEEAAIEGLKAGADDYLVKPFSGREMLARVSAHLEMAKVREKTARQERQHAERLQKLAQAALAINSILSSEEILWLITDQARTIIGAHQGITSRKTDETWAQAVHAISLSEKYAYWRDYDVRPDGSGIYALVCNTNTPLRMTQEELERHPAWRGFGHEAANHPPIRGWLAAPLIGRNGRNLGIIQLSDKYDGSEFSAEDESILVQLSQMASVAIENALLYQQAQDALRGRDELLSMVSHDLKNPVGTVKGYAQLLRRLIKRDGSVSSEQVMDGLTKIDETSTKMTILINELLEYGRLQSGQPLTLDYQPTNLVSLTQQVITEQQRTTTRHQLIFETTVQELLGNWDAFHLERVMINLLSNAIKYSPDGGDIAVTVTQPDDTTAQVIVRDQGIGIPEADLPHIFEQFQRAGNTRSKIKGTGIGLASARQVVEQHNGTITVESQEGAGSVFTVLLPLNPP
jgi:signal transduction histidine kinase/FixJ family two-component response regulator